jgi:Protein of unknown function (DUF2971)
MTDRLRRYTNLPSVLYLLRERKITLLDPETWDDKNDSHYLSIYRERKSLKCVLALCFTQVAETYHHWRVFADGSAGICVRFDRDKLVAAMQKTPGVTMKDVTYLKLEEMRGKKKLKVEELPFLKRYPYEDEREFRVIYESDTKRVKSLDIAIPLTCVDRIIISPWMPCAVTKHVKKTLREIDDCQNLDVVQSSLISNERWKNYGDGAA